jgi:hypothetical protein
MENQIKIKTIKIFHRTELFLWFAWATRKLRKYRMPVKKMWFYAGVVANKADNKISNSEGNLHNIADPDYPKNHE